MQENSKKEKILIIEGDRSFGERLAESLNAEGYQTTLSTDGAEGMKIIYDLMPHLVLVDIILPTLDGYGIIEKKNSEPLLAKIPVFLISTQGTPINMQRIPQGSVKEFILDLHADVAEIVKRINSVFGYENTDKSTVQVGKKKSIFWVEDDKLIGTILAKKLIASGFDLAHAKNGEEALAMIQNTRPDVIVLDPLIPGMSGFDVLQKIKSVDSLKNVPVMILSNLNKQSDIDRAKLLGAQKFLVKAAASLDQIVLEIKNISK